MGVVRTHSLALQTSKTEPVNQKVETDGRTTARILTPN